MSNRLDMDAIRRAHPLPSIVAQAGLKPVKAGNEFKACCPFHSDKSPSFTIFRGGQRFHCFGCGASGDVLDFLARLHGVGLRDAAQMLGTADLSTVHFETAPVDDKADRIDEARSIWRAADTNLPEIAQRYFQSRCIHAPIPASIRFARLRYGKSGGEHPCLVAAIASVENKLIGIQRTYLAPDGRGKAAVPKPKLSLGRITGGAIRLAPCAQSMIVCEGLEDGLTLMQELGRAVWVAAGASNLPRMQFPAGVRSVAIGGDGDPPGREAARKAADAYLQRGLEARTFFPVAAKDFNAEIMERAGE